MSRSSPTTLQRVIRLVLLAALGLSCSCGMDTQHMPDRVASSAGVVTIGSVSWFTDYEAALVAARNQDKPLWAHFGEHPG